MPKDLRSTGEKIKDGILSKIPVLKWLPNYNRGMLQVRCFAFTFNCVQHWSTELNISRPPTAVVGSKKVLHVLC